MWKRENSKGIRKQVQQAEMAGLIVSRPTRVKRGKEWVNGPRKPKEWSSKSMGIIKGKEEANGWGSSGNELVNSLGWLKGQ